VIICVTSYLIQPYNPEYPREFLNWALILLFRCAVVCLLFQINGTYDVLISTLSPMIIIIAGAFKIVREEDLAWIFPYISVTVICMFILNYIIAREYKILFLIEKQGLETKDSIFNIVNLFDGAVFIFNEKSHDMLFKTEKLAMNGYILENDGNITNKAIFLILGSQADILARKDAVRLFEHAVNDYVDRAELTDIFVNFTEVLKASIALKSKYL
jgi:hypothetical protein